MEEEIKPRTLLAWETSNIPKNTKLIIYSKLKHLKYLRRKRLYCSICKPKNKEVFYVCFKCYNKLQEKAKQQGREEITKKILKNILFIFKHNSEESYEYQILEFFKELKTQKED